MTTIFKTLAGSRLYGTHTDASDTDYKAVHLPTKRDILIRPKRSQVMSYSTGQADAKNTADDTDVESFELQRFLKLASDMQTIPVEMLFITPLTRSGLLEWSDPWPTIAQNKDKILNRNTASFVGYCKGQAVKYSMRGERLGTYKNVCKILAFWSGTIKTAMPHRVADIMHHLLEIDGVKRIEKNHNGKMVGYLDVFGRQVPETLPCAEAYNVYVKPVEQAGKRAQSALEAGGADLKALYHAMRIVDQGIMLYKHGIIQFPAENVDYLMKIRAGELEMDAILDRFDEKLDILMNIGDNSPLPAKSDHEWIDDFVAEQYEKIVKGV